MSIVRPCVACAGTHVLISKSTRISPRQSPAPPASDSNQQSPSATKRLPSAPEREVDLDISMTPPPVEDTLAARRARRQAILAKYAGISSINTSQTATPSPGPSSAAEPPTANSAISDPSSRLQSVAATPAPFVTPSASEHPDSLG